MRGLRTEDGGPPFGPDPELTLLDGPHSTGIVDRISDGPVPLPAVDGGRVAWSPADGRLTTGDGNSDGCITTGFQRWNMDGDVEDQYETFNCMPVYYGGDLYDSEDSDWDDSYALSSAAYVEDYNFDVPVGMDLMVHRHCRFPESSDVRQDCQMDVAPIYQTVSYAMKDEWNTSANDSLTMPADEMDEWNTSDNDSLTMTADENDPDMNDFYQRVVSSDDENDLDLDNGSVSDFDGTMSEGAYCVVSHDGSAVDLDVDMLDIVDYGDSDAWSVTDFSSCSSGVDVEDDCDFNMISIVDREMYLYGRRLCLMCPVGTADLRILQNGSVDDLRMDHSRTVSWDPGIADSRTISVCYDCLCLMALFRTVVYLAHYWAGRMLWTGPDEGSGRSMAWREQYLPGLYPPCVVDRLPNDATEIKVFDRVSMIHV